MSENKRGRKKTKDRVSTAIMIDRDLYEWTVGRNRSDIVNMALREYKGNLDMMGGGIPIKSVLKGMKR